MNDFGALSPLAGLLGTILGVLVVAIIIFLILREFVTWYWKINQIVTLLEGILSELGAIRKRATRMEVPAKEDVAAKQPPEWLSGQIVDVVEKTPLTEEVSSKTLFCAECRAEIEKDDRFCPECGQKL